MARLRAAGERIDALTEGRDPAERAEGYRFLTRVLSAATTFVMEGQAPACRYWSAQLCSRWLESRDYENRQVILNHEQARLAADGTFRIVVAGRDPGEPNWLDAGGHGEGGVIFRWLLPRGEGWDDGRGDRGGHVGRPRFRVERMAGESGIESGEGNGASLRSIPQPDKAGTEKVHLVQDSVIIND
nr:MAG: Protein of unknown function (DUF1214) [Candidatus Kentron sp. H]